MLLSTATASSSLASLVLLLPTLVLAASRQDPFHSLHSSIDSPTTHTTTLVDALSSDPEFTTLIHLLQRTKLIPTLNKLNGSTLFAPTNDAFARARQNQPALLPDSLYLNNLSPDYSRDNEDRENSQGNLLPDNVLFPLRQTLLYHILNFTLPEASDGSGVFPSSHPQSTLR